MTKAKLISLVKSFQVPLLVFAGLVLYLGLSFFHAPSLFTLLVAIITIALGSFGLFKETFEDIKANQFALDYIAILAIVVSLVTREYIVGMVIALMLSSGRTLEEYGANQAKRSLSLLADRIPHEVLVEEKDKTTKKVPIESVAVGSTIIIRKGEVIPLDGYLLSENGLVDESSLTGEPYAVEKIEKDTIRSGTVNLGDVMRIHVTKAEKESTYSKIITMVEEAAKEKAPLVRLADKYSVVFTIITFVIAALAFFHLHTLEAILAVLVVATPCPLILATPIALLGGVNAAAKKRIIVKNLASLETLSRANTIIFDKTGTITLGKPEVTSLDIFTKSYSKTTLLGIAEAIERNSLHPLAKAIVSYAKKEHAPLLHAEKVEEIIGKGISGTVNKKTYFLSKLPKKSTGMEIGLFEKKILLGTFSFEDKVKHESSSVISMLKNMGISLAIFTGDKKQAAEKVVTNLGIPVEIYAELKPEDKATFINRIKTNELRIKETNHNSKRNVVGMIGDGINDAPALALADVGMVFSNEEQTAASEAADIVFLGGSFQLVLEALEKAKNTIGIAKQSIFWGIGMSIGAMIAAAFGLIPPLFGAILQEAIDVVVILNALRAAK